MCDDLGMGQADAKHDRRDMTAMLEAVLIVADEPVPTQRLARVLDVTEGCIDSLLEQLADEYRGHGQAGAQDQGQSQDQGHDLGHNQGQEAAAESRPQGQKAGACRPPQRARGFELRKGAQGWRFYSSARYADIVEQFIVDGSTGKLSQAAVETLAVIAYRQPVSRGTVSAIRGVNVDGVVRTLLTRGLIEESAQDPSTGASLFVTSDAFLDYLGIRSLDELPPLAPQLPGIDQIADLTV